MSSCPITDPAEIAKLPEGYYLFTCPKWMNGYEGTEVLKKCKDGDLYWANDDGDNWFHPSELAEAGGGIQCELVPATERDELAALLREALDECDRFYPDNAVHPSDYESGASGAYGSIGDLLRPTLAKLEEKDD